MEKRIDGTDEHGNKWSIFIRPNENNSYRHKAYLSFNDKEFVLYNFSKACDTEYFWDLLTTISKQQDS